MSAKYATTGQQAANTSTPGKTTLEFHAVTAGVRRAWMYFLSFGFSGTPADNALRMQIMETTAAGTATAVVPTRLGGGADAVAVSVSGENHSAEPTITAASEKLDISLNQRTTYQWQAIPGGEFVIPATNLAGLLAKAFHASYTSPSEATIHFEE